MSFGVDDQPTLQTDDDLFVLDLLTVLDLPDGSILARNKRNGRQMVLPLDVYSAIAQCSSFRSQEGHANELVRRNPSASGRQSEIHSLLQSIRQGGLTLPAAEVCDRLASSVKAESVDDKPVVVIITCDRPDALQRLLQSLLANSDQERMQSCYVIDDSRDAENRTRNRNIAREFTSKLSVGVRYLGEDEASGIMAALIERLPHHEKMIRFLIDRQRWASFWTAGIARNISQLVSVGCPVIILDDDVLFEVFDPPFTDPGVEFSTREREIQLFRDRKEWQGMQATRNPDLIGRHMQCLGLSLPDALSVLGIEKLDPQALAHAGAAMANRLQRSSRVLITQCGSFGDPGTGTNRWLATMNPTSRERLLGSPGLLEHALNERNCWMGRTRPVFEASANISQATGLDNRGYLPPYFPIDRGQDRLFGYMVEFIFA
jgi:hypothetical protein